MHTPYSQLMICPEWISQGVLDKGDGIEKIFDLSWMLDNFLKSDVALLQALQTHHTVRSAFGKFQSVIPSNYTSQGDKEMATISILAKSPDVQGEITQRLLQAPQTHTGINSSGKWVIHDCSDKRFILVISQGVLAACSNDNYLMTIVRELAKRVFASEDMHSALMANDFIEHYLRMATVLNSNRPPKPTFA